MTHKIPEQYLGQDVAYCGKCKQWKPKKDFSKSATRPSGVYGHCKICKKEWRKNNPERAFASASKWRKNNPERASAYARKWRKNNPDHKRKWQENNPERSVAYARKWRENNPERSAAACKRWRESNPAKILEYREKAKKIQAERVA